MKQFDKKLKELSRNVNIPSKYDQKIDEVLRSLPEKEIPTKNNKKVFLKRGLAVAICILCLVCVLKIDTLKANANIFETFKLTLMDIFNINQEDTQGDGNKENKVESNETQIESKPDLMLELRETVMDSHNIYLLVKITAPANVELNKDIAFDYYAFCEGENYNTNSLLSGAKDCYMLESMKEKPNVATYVVTLTSDKELTEDSMVTVSFKDLERNPLSNNPEMLVEGMWSISFAVSQTVKDEIVIDGNADMTFPFLDTTAVLERIELTPLGITVLSDVSKVPHDDLGISDTTIAIRLVMMDGSEQLIMTHNMEDELIIDSGSREYLEENGKEYQKDTYAFEEMVDINKVVGVYIEDLYVAAFGN